jgi:anti-sigma regulatory factor (Ser/Thr protein kinase)
VFEDLSLHILDIAENSVNAGATVIEIKIEKDSRADTLTIEVKDNGRGMDREFAAKVEDPFVTTRTTRKVGLGIPAFAQAARATGGAFEIESAPGEGTTVRATFGLSHIDRQPMGDLGATLLTLMIGSPKIDFRCTLRSDSEESFVSSAQIREILRDVPLSSPQAIRFLKGFLSESTTGF